MTDLEQLRQQMLLRHATGYIELGEILIEGDEPVPPSSQRLLMRALSTLAELPEAARGEGVAGLLEGEALRALGRWQEALVPFGRVVKEDTSRVEAWLGIGWCLKRLDRLADAIEALRRGLVSAPEKAILHYNLACYLSLVRDAAAAADHLARAISLDGRYRDLSGEERDFDPIRHDPRFLAATHLAL